MANSSRFRNMIPGACPRTGVALALAVVLALAAATTQLARPKTENVRSGSTRHPSDGWHPNGALVRDTKGNLYGTTGLGGGGTGCGMTGCGIVFQLTPGSGGRWTETALHRFAGGADGANPNGGMILDAEGNLYGTTAAGGGGTACGGCGTVFRLSPSSGGRWTEKVLYRFVGGTDGATPLAGLVRDAEGNFYGTTNGDGDGGLGTVFEITSSGEEEQLYAFAGGQDGAGPYGGLVRDGQGNLYGTTAQGGGTNNAGTVFEIIKDGTEKVLYRFTGYSDGGVPYGGLVRDAQGNLYGTTYSGGAADLGTAFELDPTGTEKVLHSFVGADGAYPHAGFVRDAKGDLYGTTVSGGTSGNGTVFKLTPGSGGRWTEKVLYSLSGTDGIDPTDALLRDAKGNLYGATSAGGSGCNGFGCGTIFRLALGSGGSWKETTLYNFKGGAFSARQPDH